MKKCVVVINPTSGHGLNDRLATKIVEVLEEFNYVGEVYITEYAGHAEEIVRDAECDLLISVGGDGTFYETMNGNFKREKQLVLSHIPVGTTNDVGHMFGLTKDIITNLRSILSGSCASSTTTGFPMGSCREMWNMPRNCGPRRLSRECVAPARHS